MSVLARELEAYQSALDRYRRQLGSYNKTTEAYNASILTDAEGRAYVRDASGNVFFVRDDGSLKRTSLSDGKIAGDYGATAIEGNKKYFLMRQNPTEQKQQFLTDVRSYYDSDTGQTIYYYYDPNSGSGDSGLTSVNVNQNLYRLYSTQPGTGSGDYETPPTYTFATDASTYLEKPGEFMGQLRAKRPDPTAAQLRKLNNPGLAEQERKGLISNEILRGGGVLSGGLVRAGSTNTAPPAPPPPTNPNDPGVINALQDPNQFVN